MTTPQLKFIIYGYGNPGRQDDGLGVMLAEMTEKWAGENKLDHIFIDSNYQLNIEDAETISNADVVIFADASSENIDDFLLEPLLPSATVEFTMHAVSPAFILHMCHEVFNKTPEAWLLHIRAYEWEFMKPVTPKALDNLEKAFSRLKQFITSKAAF